MVMRRFLLRWWLPAVALLPTVAARAEIREPLRVFPAYVRFHDDLPMLVGYLRIFDDGPWLRRYSVTIEKSDGGTFPLESAVQRAIAKALLAFPSAKLPKGEVGMLVGVELNSSAFTDGDPRTGVTNVRGVYEVTNVKPRGKHLRRARRTVAFCNVAVLPRRRPPVEAPCAEQVGFFYRGNWDKFYYK
jgi:hypothetical protein